MVLLFGEKKKIIALVTSNMNTPTTPIIEFYFNNGPDCKGRTLDQILKFDDVKFDGCHDFIQWLFPIHEKSRHADGDPIISICDSAFFSDNTKCKLLMGRSLERFKQFLGLKPRDDKKIAYWCNDGDHNLLRITRVIRSLRLFGLQETAKQFHTQVVHVSKNRIGKRTLGYWDRAMYDSLFDSMQQS